MVELIQPNAPLSWGGGPVWGSGTWGGTGDLVTQLPPALRLTKAGFAQRVETAKRIFSDGRHSWGDEVDDREAIVEGLVETASRAEMLVLMDTLRHRCQIPGQRLRIDAGRFLALTRLREFEDEPLPGFDRAVTKLRLVWQCDNPYWQAETEQVRTVELSGNTDFEVSLGLPRCLRGQHPRITVTAEPFLALGTFTLESLTDGGLQFRYSDPLLINGASAVIDCAAGTVTRGSTNTLRYFEGEFLRLLDGVNTLRYTGIACTLEFRWRHQWL